MSGLFQVDTNQGIETFCVIGLGLQSIGGVRVMPCLMNQARWLLSRDILGVIQGDHYVASGH